MSEANCALAKWLRAVPYVLGAYAVRTAVAVVAAYPIAKVVKSSFGALPSGDVRLFEPGALMLVEFMRIHRAPISAWMQQGAMVVALMLPVSVIVTTFVLAAMVSAATSQTEATAVQQQGAHQVTCRAIGALGPVTIISVLVLLFSVVAMVASYMLGQGVSYAVVRWAGDPAGDISLWMALGIGTVMVVQGVAIADIARAISVSSGCGVAEALAKALVVTRTKYWSIIALFLSRIALCMLIITLNISMLLWVGVASKGGAIAVIVVQQVSLLAIGLIRAWWLSDAMGFGDCKRA